METGITIIAWKNEFQISVYDGFSETEENEILLSIKHTDTLDEALEYAKEQLQPNAPSHEPTVKVGDSESGKVSEQNRKDEVKKCPKCDEGELSKTRLADTPLFELRCNMCKYWTYWDERNEDADVTSESYRRNRS